MTGDGTNDAPALAQADVAVAMNTGTQAAKEAGNMVDLDSNPTKLIEIVEIGKQMLMTRGSLTTFSIANDVAKYFAIIPAAFVTTYPQLRARRDASDVAGVGDPVGGDLQRADHRRADPARAEGRRLPPLGAATLLRRNLLIYGWAACCCRSSASS
jgi:K+-transporting ATPase ATPase B chain